MRLAIAATLIVLAGPGWAAEPQFSDFPAGPIYKGAAAPPIVIEPRAKMFRTRITEGAHDAINFAGHYTFVPWGCGTGCAEGAVVDKATGRVLVLPFGVCCTTHFEGLTTAIVTRANSRLILFWGKINEEGDDAKHYFEFDGSDFKPISSVPFKSTAAAETPKSECKAIASAVERLDCYDKASGR